MIICLAEFGLDEFRISQYALITFESIPLIITWCKTSGASKRANPDGVVKSLIYCVVAVFQEFDILHV